MTERDKELGDMIVPEEEGSMPILIECPADDCREDGIGKDIEKKAGASYEL